MTLVQDEHEAGPRGIDRRPRLRVVGVYRAATSVGPDPNMPPALWEMLTRAVARA